MTKYRIYIDEVGNPDLGSSDDPNHRFLSLTGVISVSFKASTTSEAARYGGRNYCERMKKALAGPMACAIHLR